MATAVVGGGGAAATPKPVNWIDCGLPTPELTMLMEPNLLPVVRGVNVTVSVQNDPGETTPQPELLPEKSAPFRVRLDMATAWPPMLLMFTDCGALVVPTV